MTSPNERDGDLSLILPEDPRAWEAIGHRPDDDIVQSYKTARTFLCRWHRWAADDLPIRHTDDYTEVELPDGAVVRAYGRVLADDGTDLTHEYADSD